VLRAGAARAPSVKIRPLAWGFGAHILSATKTSSRIRMSNPVSAPIGIADLVVREPRPEELGRVAYLFQETRIHAGARVFVAERTAPVARFLGAAAWWIEGDLVQFQLGCLPGVAQAQVAAVLVQRVLTIAHESGRGLVQYAELLPQGHVWLAVLEAEDFERIRSERSFEIPYEDAWSRVVRLHERHRQQVPTDWRTSSIRNHPPELILGLIAPHRLLRPEEVRHFWQETTRGGFDLEVSNILFAGERPFGAFLARRLSAILYIDVQVVVEPSPRLRSLADLCQLNHAARVIAPGGPVRWIQLRSGETEHRQTANLARRMGGRELPSRHVLGRRLKR
jgi:hypothetical protein